MAKSEFDWDRDTFKVIDRYFAQPKILVAHQIESYNNTVETVIPAIINHQNPIQIPGDWDEKTKRFNLMYEIRFKDVYMCRPLQRDDNVTIKPLYPHEARLRNLTYSAPIFVDLEQKLVDLSKPDNPKILGSGIEKKVPLCNFPVMLQSNYCHLSDAEPQDLPELGENLYDIGGYFIINGNEKVIIPQERSAENKVLCFSKKGELDVVEVKSTIDQRFNPVNNISVSLKRSKDTDSDRILMVEFKSIKQPVNLFVVFRALGIETDHEILQMILGFYDPNVYNTEAGQKDQSDQAGQKDQSDQAGQKDRSDQKGQSDKSDQSEKPSKTEKPRKPETPETPGRRPIATQEEDLNLLLPTAFETFKEKNPRQGALPKMIEKKITNQTQALRHLANKMDINQEYVRQQVTRQQPSKFTADEKAEAIDAYMLKYVREILARDFLPHIGRDYYEKAVFLAYMTRRLLDSVQGRRPYDDRDHYANKRLDLAGILLIKIFRENFTKLIRDIKSCISTIMAKSNGKLNGVEQSIRKTITNCKIESGLKYALATGDWSTGRSSTTKASSSTVGIAQVLARLSLAGTVSYLRRLQSPLEKEGGKLVAPRRLHGSQIGRICPNETPEGQQVGVVKNLALMAKVTLDYSPLAVYYILKQLHLTPLKKLDFSILAYTVKVFVNGRWLGNAKNTEHARQIYRNLQYYKRTRNPDLGVSWNFEFQEIHVRSDGGRYLRPLYLVDFDESKIKDFEPDDYRKLRPNRLLIEKHWAEVKDYSWKQLLLLGAGDQPLIEYLDVEEEENALVAPMPGVLNRHFEDNNFTFLRYTHCEIHASTWLGMVSSVIPFSDHNQSPRNCYQSSMGKQSIGIYATNYNQRMDTAGSNVLCYPQRPLVSSRSSSYIGLDKAPHGEQIMVAIACFTGYNQEDSVMMNKSAIDRGRFNSLHFQTHVVKINSRKSSTSEVENFGMPPDMSATRGIKGKRDDNNYPAYRYLDPATGVVRVGSKFDDLGPDEEIVIVSKYVAAKRQASPGDTSKYKYKDISLTIRPDADSTIDRVLGRNGDIKNYDADQKEFIKVREVSMFKPEIGDKMASRSAQKGTIGMLYRQEDMPFTGDGMVPDLIMNPHAIPSRMTIAQVLECLICKVAIKKGVSVDATPFTNPTPDEYNIHNPMDYYKKVLGEYDLHPQGEEVMFNPMTGEQFEATIFFGPTYYQRLKHLARLKAHSRAEGPIKTTTRQPSDGRARDGGFRLGEMERDVLISHAVSSFLKERFVDSSDIFKIFIDRESQHIITANPERGIFKYGQKDISPDQVFEAQPPYTLSLFLRELGSMGIDIRLIQKKL